MAPRRSVRHSSAVVRFYGAPHIRHSSTRALLALSAAALLCAVAAPAAQQASQIDTQPAAATLFRNVKIFDGRSDRLSPSTSVLVVGNKIAKIGAGIAAPTHATIIEA